MNAGSVRDLAKGALRSENLGRNLRSAHIPIANDTYMKITLAATVCTAVAGGIVIAVLLNGGFSYTPVPFLSASITAALLLAVVIAGVFLAFLVYPTLVAQGRKTQIDLDLPYAITYMQALSTTMSLLNIFRLVHENEDLYGEVSRECGIIVRNIDIFGDDLLTAMRDVQLHTPSEAFASLLNDLGIMFKTGGDITAFFASRSAQYREIAAQEMEMTLKTMEVMAEVYVTAFVAGPIAINIMMVAQNMSGQNGGLTDFMPLMYILLPLGAMIMIGILYIMMPPDSLKVTRSVTREAEYGNIPDVKDAEKPIDGAFLKLVKSKKAMMKYAEILRHPVRHYISDYTYSLIFGGVFSAILAILYMNGFMAEIFPTFTEEVFLSLVVVAMMVPVAVAYQGRRWYLTQIEEQLPEFLRDISDMKDMGMTLQGAIRQVSEGKIGVLSSELQYVSEDMRMGTAVSTALVRMEQRIGLVSVKRAISLIVRASEVTDYLRDILTIAISDLEHYLKMKYERFSVSFIYVAIIYLSFGIYLYSAYQLNTSFISSFDMFNLNLNVENNIVTMFHISLILGGFSGIMAGQLSSNSVLGGLKHSIIFIIASIVLFVFLI